MVGKLTVASDGGNKQQRWWECSGSRDGWWWQWWTRQTTMMTTMALATMTTPAATTTRTAAKMMTRLQLHWAWPWKGSTSSVNVGGNGDSNDDDYNHNNNSNGVTSPVSALVDAWILHKNNSIQYVLTEELLAQLSTTSFNGLDAPWWLIHGSIPWPLPSSIQLWHRQSKFSTKKLVKICGSQPRSVQRCS